MAATWDRIDAELTRRELTWAWLARTIEVTDQVVNNWKRRGVPASRYEAIAGAFGWTVDQLLNERQKSSNTTPALPPDLTRDLAALDGSVRDQVLDVWRSVIGLAKGGAAEHRDQGLGGAALHSRQEGPDPCRVACCR